MSVILKKWNYTVNKSIFGYKSVEFILHVVYV